MRPAHGRVDPLSAPYGDEPSVYHLYYLRLSRRGVGRHGSAKHVSNEHQKRRTEDRKRKESRRTAVVET